VLADDGVKPVLGERIVWEKDGSEMVLIPAGTFEMGDHFGDGEGDEQPVHRVELDAFYMDVCEVTVGQFREFVNQSGYKYGGNWANVAKYSPGNDYPMIYVTWSDATAYAKWVGKRLPTEAEWEYAARGGLAGKRYPWGDEMTKAHYGSWNGGRGTTKAVGSFGVNRYGLYDMAGNVWEWCQDWYSKDYYQNSAAKNPSGPNTGSRRVLRGGSWYDVAVVLRVASRGYSLPAYRNGLNGFRCVSGSNLIFGASAAGGDFTNDEEASSNEEVPLPLAGNQGVIEWEKDNSEMALIPAGSFEMGDHLDGMSNALPVHTMELDAFYMDVHEVTVGQFREFVNQSGYKYGGNWANVAKYSLGDRYPMVYVSWNDAVAYAKWVGKRLPTEAEWEYAARGGLVGKRYPWGDEISHDDANYSGTGGKDKWVYTAPVGSFAANGYGLYDMAGNVYEWCLDRFGSDYYSKSPTKNPPGADIGLTRVLRGGNWAYDSFTLRVANRNNAPPNNWSYPYGFRCVSGGGSDTIAEIERLSVSGSGKYKVGDKISIKVIGEENAFVTFQIAGITGKEPLLQGMSANEYRASYTFRSGERALNTKLIIELTDQHGNVATKVAKKTVSIVEELQLNRSR
jgi:formylglycine-generating enzyme required for sulfatase activity